jgi:hypothetical protein
VAGLPRGLVPANRRERARGKRKCALTFFISYLQTLVTFVCPVHLACQPLASSTFLSEQTSQQYFSLRTNQQQPPAKRIVGCPPLANERSAAREREVLSTLVLRHNKHSSSSQLSHAPLYALLLSRENRPKANSPAS